MNFCARVWLDHIWQIDCEVSPLLRLRCRSGPDCPGLQLVEGKYGIVERKEWFPGCYYWFTFSSVWALCNSEEYIRLTRADRTILKSQYTGQKCVGHCVIFSFSIKNSLSIGWKWLKVECLNNLELFASFLRLVSNW